jgi:RNA 2',3'-cyclic 3'-phosphodiesterase
VSESWRLFIGLPAPPDVREEIDRRTAALRDVDLRARWVTASNLHVTLLFLGDRCASDVPAIVAAIEDIARRHDAYDLELKGAGAFGGGRGGRTVWLRVDGGRAETAALATELGAALEPADSADERVARRDSADPKPHLTLARAASPALVGRVRLELHDLSFRWRVEHVHVYRSRLGHGPPVYEELAAVRLGVRARV